MATTLYTIGHSTRAIEALLDVLVGSRIETLVDIRAFPRSRRHPQFNRPALEMSCASRGICYWWRGKALGGFRKPRSDSRHVTLRHPALRGFADYMEADAFEAALSEVLRTAVHERLAIMCAERDPAECHRALISDAALVRGARVVHLIDLGEQHEARMSVSARVEGAALVYDGGQPRLLDDA
jgi:uncharacterized protein (DUF488 family)